MPKPEYSNTDPSPADSDLFDVEAGSEDLTDDPLFSNSSASPQDGEGDSSHLELFPMPDMSMLSEEEAQAIPDQSSLDFDLSQGDRTVSQEAVDLSTDYPGVDLESIPGSTGEFGVEENGRVDEISEEQISTDDPVEEAIAAIDSEHGSQEKKASAVKSRKKKIKARKRDSALKSKVVGWGNKLAQSPVFQKVSAFRGWPWVIALGASGATSMTAFAWLAGLPPVPNCKNPSTSWGQSGKLYCADQAARQKEPEALASALDMVGDWDPDDPMFEQVSKLSDDWSRSILDVAERELDQGKLNEAIKLAEKVPKSSSYYEESQANIENWQGSWKEGERILEKARDAIQEQDWAVGADQLRQLVQLGGEHWQRRADKLISEMTIEQEAFRKLNLANDQASYGTVKDIESAISLATQIDSKRLARQKLLSYVDQWSQKLIDLADYHYEIGNYDTVIEAAQAVPPGAKVADEAIAYLQASRAQKASQDDTPLGYVEAVAYASQVPKDAEIASETQEEVEDWQGQVQAWAQLEFAKVFTRFDQPEGYKIAMDHAALVEPENPNRVQAQTLIAQWDKQLNSVADRQAIARAAQLAKQPDLSSLQAAIAEAKRINIESPLRVRAQTLIAEWEGSIEKRQDQPILDKAIALANTGNLQSAIDMADQISSDRALYDEAQDAIYGWQSKIQVTQDQPILTEARSLASQGQLSAAIAKASEVGYGRALYYEAQDLIGQWITERNRIEAARRPERRDPEPAEDPYREEDYYQPEEQYNEPQANTYIENDPLPSDSAPEEYVDSASGAGSSGGPENF